MDRTFKLVVQDIIDLPLTVDPRSPGKSRTDNLHPKECLAFRSSTTMTNVQIGLINDL